MSETLPAAAEPTPGPVDTAPQAEPVVQEAPKPTEPKPDTTPTWLRKKIDDATREKHDALRQKEAAEARASELAEQVAAFRRQQGVGQPQQQEPHETPQQIETRVREQERTRLANEAKNNEFIGKCNSIAQAMTQAGLDLAAVQHGFNDVGLDFTNPAHQEFVSDIAELPNAGQVYYALGTDREEASRIMQLGARAQARELAALSGRLAAQGAPEAPALSQPVASPMLQRQVSGAPRPPAAGPRPIPQGGGKPYSEMSMDEFVRTRNKEDRKR